MPIPRIEPILGKMADGSQQDFVSRYKRRQQTRREFGPLADRYASFYRHGDPLADALVEWLTQNGKEAHQALERALQNIADETLPAELPAPLRAFLEDVRQVPDWADFDEINLGADAYQRLGLLAMIVLSAWSLVNGYHSSAAVKPLVFTGELTEHAPRRLIETAGFVSDVIQRDSLRPGGKAHVLTVRVRIVHAHVRRACAGRVDWRQEEWGVPINQADMFGTLLEFSLLVVEGSKRLGFRMTDRERDAIFNMWRYAGHLSGVHSDLLDELSSEARAYAMGDLVRLVQPGPDQDSVALTQALLRVPALHSGGVVESMFAATVSKYHDGLARALNGSAISDALGVPDTAWKWAIYPTYAVVRPLEAMRRRVPGLSALFSFLGNQAIRKDLNRKQLRGSAPKA